MFLAPTKGKIRSPEIVLKKVLMTLLVNLTIWVKKKKTSFKRDGDRCFFCKKKGHIKKDCAKFKAWLSKREPTGNDSLALVCEFNLSEAPSNSWWLDSGATNHVAFTIQGFINRRKPNQD